MRQRRKSLVHYQLRALICRGELALPFSDDGVSVNMIVNPFMFDRKRTAVPAAR